MNKKIIYILIPLVLVLLFIFSKKNKENFNAYSPAEETKCKEIRNSLYEGPAYDGPAISVEDYRKQCEFKTGITGKQHLNIDYPKHYGSLRHIESDSPTNKNKVAWSTKKNLRYSFPTVDNIQTYNLNTPQIGRINVHSPPIVKNEGNWKWFKDGNLEKSASTALPSKENVIINWDKISSPFIASRDNGEDLKPATDHYIDHAQSATVLASSNKAGNILNPESKWGSKYDPRELSKTSEGEPYTKTGNGIEHEPPLNKIDDSAMALPGKGEEAIPVAPLKKIHVAKQEYGKLNENPGESFDEFLKNSAIRTPKDLDRYIYKRKILPKNYSEENKQNIQAYGIPLNGVGQLPSKVLASSGFDESTMNLNGDLLKNNVELANKIEISQEKKCPEEIKHRYYFTKEGIAADNQWYIGGIGGSYSAGGKEVRLNEPNKGCTICSEPNGCRYPDVEGGKYSADYFEQTSCGNGQDRKCKKCRTCKMGLEVVETDCGEGGGASERICNKCSECEDGHYKVYGCDKPNSFFDTECKPFSKCLGKKPIEGESFSQTKYQNLNIYDSDPGAGNRLYKLKDGFPGGFKNKDAIDPETGKASLNPYFGRDTKCAKCDTCPTGWKHLRGCLGENDGENTVCQRSISKESYLAKNFQCPKGQFYNKDAISAGIENENIKLENADENVRNEIKQFNTSIKNDLTKIRKNINDPKNFPNELPIITDDQLKEWGCTKCSICDGESSHRDPNNPGCEGDKDTKCKNHTECKGSQYISKKGDSFNDQLCSSCRCPQPNYYGIPNCEKTTTDTDGIIVPDGCKRKIDCINGEYTSNDPGAYGDTTKPRVCSTCKKCQYGTYEVDGGCRLGGATDTICKNWKKCDKNTMIVMEPGTDAKDTICKCLDGYELPKDDMGRIKKDATNCVQIKGKCHTNPCHPKANCFDNFTDDGDYMETICKCDLNKGFIQTQDRGFGKDGCQGVPGKHNHEIKAPAASYGELPAKFAKILTHLDGDYHRNTTSNHLHKSSPYKLENDIN